MYYILFKYRGIFTIVVVQCFDYIKLSVSEIYLVKHLTELKPLRNKIKFPSFPLSPDHRLVVISPPEVGGEQSFVMVHHVKVVGQLLCAVEVPHVDIGVRQRQPGHVGAVRITL